MNYFKTDTIESAALNLYVSDWKISDGRTGRSVFNPKKAMPKCSSNTLIYMLISNAKNSQARLQQGRGTPDVWTERQRKPEIKLPALGSWKSKVENICFCFVIKRILWILANCGKFWRKMEFQTAWPASWKSACRSGNSLVRIGRKRPALFQT